MLKTFTSKKSRAQWLAKEIEDSRNTVRNIHAFHLHETKKHSQLNRIKNNKNFKRKYNKTNNWSTTGDIRINSKMPFC